jgi:DNA-binding transcriptional LysR family regulator
MLDPQRLRALQVFALRGTIAAAAESLGYSPAAVSQQLSALERETGTPLLERTARSATLTPAGRALADRAGPILDALESARSETLAVAGGTAGDIGVSTIPTAATVVAPVLTDLMAEHRGLHVALHQSGSAEALQRLRTREVDLAVLDAWQPTREPDLVLSSLARDPLVLTIPARHPWADRATPVGLADLAEAVEGRTWLCAPMGQPSRTIAEEILARSAARPAATWEVEGLTTIGQLVGRGVGVALLPVLALRDLSGGVATVPLRPARHRRLVAATRRGSPPHPVVAACLRSVRSADWAVEGA